MRAEGVNTVSACGDNIKRGNEIQLCGFSVREHYRKLDGQFETIKTQNAVESQSAFLTADDEFVTFAEGYSVLRVYKSATMVCEIPLDKSENITATIRMGDTIVGSCKTNSWSLKYWELN